MVATELIERVFKDSGEPEDLQIYATPGDDTTFDITLPGSVKLLRLLNTALTRVANWRFPDGRLLRVRDLRGRLMFNTGAPIAVSILASTYNSVTLGGFTPNYAGEFDGWTIEVTGGTGAGHIATVRSSVLSGTNIELFVDPVWVAVPDNTSMVKLTKNFFEFRRNPTMPWETYHIPVDFTNHMGDILKVRDISGLTDLARTYNDDMFTANMRTSGVPSQWKLFGNELWFDVAPAEARTYELLYIKNPAALVGANDVPELPEMYHEAVALWAVHNVMRQNQDFNGAYATKRELEDLMQQLRLQGSFDMEADIGGLTVWG
jgi:hypothetical protein